MSMQQELKRSGSATSSNQRASSPYVGKAGGRIQGTNSAVLIGGGREIGIYRSALLFLKAVS